MQNTSNAQGTVCEEGVCEQDVCGQWFCYAGSCMWYCVALSPHGLASCCLFVSATLVHRGPDVRWLFWFPANVRNAVLITARCPGLWLRSCAAVCCRSSYPLLASSPSQQRTRFSRPGVSPDRQYCCGMLSAMLFHLRLDIQPPCYGPARPCVAVHPPGPLLCMGATPPAFLISEGLYWKPATRQLQLQKMCNRSSELPEQFLRLFLPGHGPATKATTRALAAGRESRSRK